jgi:hypothetical protein
MFKLSSRRLSSVFTKKILVSLVILLGVYITFLWHLGKLTAGLSPEEAKARLASSSWHFIFKNPINAPHKILQNIAQALDHHGAFYMRLSSVVFMVIFLLCFYWLLKGWFGKTIAFMGSIILAGTPLFILSARSATGHIMLLTPLAVMAAYMFCMSSRKTYKLGFLVLLVVATISIYIPGMIWFVLAAGFIKRQEISQKIKSLSMPILVTSGYVALLILVPLILAMIRDPSILRQLLLIPADWQTPLETIKSVVWSFLALFWKTPYHIDIIIGRVAFLNIIQIALAAFGVYAMWTKARREAYQLIAILAASILLSGINNSLELLIPAVLIACIFAAAGLRYLYVEWRGVFPNNPLPKALALSLIGLVVGMHLLLGIHYALSAWPHTPSTKVLYVIK